MERFVKNKDLILRKIEKISKKEEFLIAELKDGKQHCYLIEPFLDNIDAAFAKLKDYEFCSLVVYNTKENFDVLIKNWDIIAKFKRQFSIYFINPFSKTEKRWSIYPMTHNMVTEKSGLKPGLITLFSNVEAVTKEEIEKILKENNQ
ncbi:hypothetical protein ACFL6I_19385 [candidate division KSB1 bacterium]